MVREIRKNLDVTYTPEYFHFLKCYTKPFYVILFRLTKPQFRSNVENKIRYVVIDVLFRLPHIEVLRPFAKDILRVAIQVLINDNEEIGLQCARIIFDIVRHFRPQCRELHKFFSYVLQLQRNFGQIVVQVFENAPVPDPEPETNSPVLPDPEPGTHSLVPDTELDIHLPVEDRWLWDADMTFDEIIHPVGGIYKDPNRVIFRSNMSLKMAAESPFTVMSLFKMKYQPAKGLVQHLVQVMIQNLSIVGPKDVPVSKMSHYIDMRAAQVKVYNYIIDL